MSGAGLQVQTLKLQLGRRQLRLQQITQRINAGLGALLLDGHQFLRKCLLLARGIQFMFDGIQFNVSRGCIQRHLLAGVLQVENGGLYTGARGLNVLL